ncbi:NAD-dependent epimerase/dehydratase family protein [Candidatus Chloroploca sp. Khr17]|uniref:NAD-dependent epimerase/dehydratase family protein n=1 Tax=Candidatus Chloroploca sp. Khr17 TaxID=2496869 RepID=UPI00101C8A47|nr:NAD-dependent epimerase/dehydratase family protein [Candidatus Chloroploca sp. Khr17]
MTILVTGGAGFIGSHVVDALLQRGEQVVCLDNFVPYYDPARKRHNLQWASQQPGFTLVEADLRDATALAALFERYAPSRIVHLAALPGPRPSIENPSLYEQVNVGGTVNLLQVACRYKVRNLVLASTSSVYGKTEQIPFVESDATDRPLSPYAATKKAAEVLAYTFHSLYGLPVSVVRFFTVYGPRGRPDMTPYLFVEKMVRQQPFVLFNGGVQLFRDYTYIDDIVGGVLAALDQPHPYEIFNLGNASPVEMQQFVRLLETITGLQAQIEVRPLPATEPPLTFADTSKAARLLGYASSTSVEEGLERFWHWYREVVL